MGEEKFVPWRAPVSGWGLVPGGWFERLGRAGLTNALGGELTAHTARKTWQRVRDAMDMPTPSQGEAPTGSKRHRPPEAASPIVEPLESDDLPPRHTFTPAKIR